MGVTIKSLNEVEAECKRFLGRVGAARMALRDEVRNRNNWEKNRVADTGREPLILTEDEYTHGCAATGAVKRASLDLSRVLAEFRR